VEEVVLTNMRCTSDEEGGRWEVRVERMHSWRLTKGPSNAPIAPPDRPTKGRGKESQLSQPIINTIKCQGKAYVARGGLRSAGLRGSNAQLTAELETVLVCHL
jgi:hypothetical protein